MINTEEVISAATWILSQLPHCWQYVEVFCNVLSLDKVFTNVMLR